jgi:amino acid adenylation domain-containing protein
MREFVFETLARRAAEHPDREAVASTDVRLSYGELERLSNQLACHLVQAGVKRGDRVAISMTKSATYVMCLYGIMKAGGCYVPIDSEYPKTRMADILEDCSIEVLIASSEVLKTLCADGPAPGVLRQVILLGDAAGAAPAKLTVVPLASLQSGSKPAPRVEHNDRDLAYILYTSGSTGKPKGVMLTHGNLMVFMDWCERAFDLGPADRIVNTAPFTFDIAGLDLYNAIWFGGMLYVVPDQRMINTVLAAIDKEKITFMSTVPTILGAMAQRDAVFKRYDLTSLRHICSGAALCQPTTMRKLKEHLPKAEQWNLYGPTEATIYCLYHRITAEDLAGDKPIPIGIPYENTEAFVIGADGKEAKVGESGELVLRGSHIAAGYYKNPEKTEAAFKNHPLFPHLNEKVYFTGDVCKKDERGRFHFLGRKDDLIKSRGYRIELNEIDLGLASLGNVLVESISVAIPDPLIENKLYAAVVLAEGKTLSDADIKTHLKSRIPEYMVPDEILFLPSLPKTSSGKISRTLLADLIKKR